MDVYRLLMNGSNRGGRHGSPDSTVGFGDHSGRPSTNRDRYWLLQVRLGRLFNCMRLHNAHVLCWPITSVLLQVRVTHDPNTAGTNSTVRFVVTHARPRDGRPAPSAEMLKRASKESEPGLQRNLEV